MFPPDALVLSLNLCLIKPNFFSHQLQCRQTGQWFADAHNTILVCKHLPTSLTDVLVMLMHIVHAGIHV